MIKLKINEKCRICSAGHDRDGFVYEEKDCDCYLTKNENGEVIFTYKYREREDYETTDSEKEEFVLTHEQLEMTVFQVCQHYCKSPFSSASENKCNHKDTKVKDLFE